MSASPSISYLHSGEFAAVQPNAYVRVVALSIALLLLATAAAKALSPREAVAWEAAYRILLWLSAVVIQVELISACLLLFAVSLRRTLAEVALLFCGFAVFSAYRAWAGYESCGCFGIVKVHPLQTLMLDVVVAVIAGIASRCAPVSKQSANVVRGHALNPIAASESPPAAWVGSAHPTTVVFAHVDGSCRPVGKDAELEVSEGMVTRAGGKLLASSF